MTPRHGAIVLAAGLSRRLGRAKQLVAIDGETLLHRTVRHVLATAPADLVVVVGSDPSIAAAIADLGVRGVTATGSMGQSLCAGLDALATGCEGVLIAVCDQPALDAAHLRVLVAHWQAQPRGAVASGYAATFGVPALLPRAWFGESAFGGDRGARDLLRRRGAEVVVVANEALSHDIDEPGDLADYRVT